MASFTDIDQICYQEQVYTNSSFDQYRIDITTVCHYAQIELQRFLVKRLG